MIQNKSLIYGLVIISGIILVWLVYADQGIEPKPDLFSEETPLILVDGKVPPKLSNFPAHLQFIDEKTCMQCHTTERKMNFGSGTNKKSDIKETFAFSKKNSYTSL